MSDNKNKRDGRDRAKVDSKDPSEVEYLHRKFPHLSHQAITGAIRAAGPVRKDVEAYIKGKSQK
jgi:hypothetical protein